MSKQMKPAEYLREPYARVLIPEEDGGFSAEILEFPGCFAEGDTTEETFKNLEAAAESWVAAALELGQEIPPPSANYDYSGKVVLRLPKSLHRAAARKAERDGVSLNQCLVTAIATWVGADNFYDRYVESMQSSPIQVVANITHNTHNIGIGSILRSHQLLSQSSIETSAGTGGHLPYEVPDLQAMEA